MTANAQDFIVALTNLPDRDAALALARALVEQRLAACVNVIDGCTSVYRWEGAIETEREVPLLIKTRAELFGKLQSAIRAAHPYELPEIVALRVQDGLTEYLGWMAAETQPVK